MNKLLIVSAMALTLAACGNTPKQIKAVEVAYKDNKENSNRFDQDVLLFNKAAGVYCESAGAKSFGTTESYLWIVCKNGERYTVRR